MATKKGGGSTTNGRDSNPKYLGIKKFGNEYVEPGNIIVRQRGTKFYSGAGTGMGKDHTIYATKEGQVFFYTSGIKNRKFIKIIKASEI
jgi:large subunit ribosomal protein L27